MVISILEWHLKGYAFLLRGNNVRSAGSIRVASAIRSVGTAILAVGVIDALGSIGTPVLAVGVGRRVGGIRIRAGTSEIGAIRSDDTGCLRGVGIVRTGGGIGTAILAIGIIDALGSIRTPVLAVGIPGGLGRIRIGAELAQIFLGLDVGTEEEHQKQKRL